MHNHSEFSALDGFGHPKEYLEQAKKIGLKAFAITEHGNEYSWVYFDSIKKDYPDIKMIYGVELYECFDMFIKDKDSKYFHLIALAKNEAGRIALNEIVTESNFKGFYYKPRVDLNLLKPYADNLIIMSACLASKISKESNYEKCIQYVKEYKSVFPHFYLEMQSHCTADQAEYNKKILKIAEETNTPFTITTDSHVAKKEDLKYQAKLVQIARDTDTASEIYEGCYMQTEDEIFETMTSQIGKENVRKGLDETNKVADLIECVDMPFQSPQLPTYPLPDGFSDNYEYLKYLTEKGWYTRGVDNLTEKEQSIRRERLNYELGVIHQMGFDGYFLIVWDFIKYAKEHGQAVGPGRGSGGGAIVDYLLGISDLDPIANNLIFERFLNPERVSMPDIDTDFADRDYIIKYLMEKYGEDKVCQIINFSYITPCVSIKDVGRVLGVPYNVCDAISKKFIYDTFQECLDANREICEKYSEYSEMFDVASHLSGRLRNVSIHAGGVGIVDTKITDYMGMKLGSKNEHVIQVDKKKVESIGIIKFDLLGVSTLNVVQEIMHDIGFTDSDLDINNPNFANDNKMYELLQNAQTNGVFQVESQGMKDLLLRLHPTTLEDISAVLALYRPDSMSALEDYVNRRSNGIAPTYIHPDMANILDSTCGCMLYQEQLMDIVRKFGGRSYGGADLFRKAIGKKDKELIKTESTKLEKEIVDNGYSESIAKEICDDFKTKGGYLFNKSHSALYSIITLQTAYLKAHYPTYFFKALLNQNKNDYGVLNKYIIDAKNFGVKVVHPSINRSDRYFIVSNNSVLFGLEAIRGLGSKVVNQIIEERENGIFTGMDNLIERIKPSTSVMVALIKSGAIPCKNKKELLLRYADTLCPQKEFTPLHTLPTQKILKEQFGIDCEVVKDKEERLSQYNKKRMEQFYKLQFEKHEGFIKDFQEKYMQDENLWEFETLSIFLEYNPFDKAYEYISIGLDSAENGNVVTIVGVISKVQKKKDKAGKQFAWVSIYSTFGTIEVVCWHSQLKQYEDLIKRGVQIAALVKKDEISVIKQMKPYKQWLIDRKLV